MWSDNETSEDLFGFRVHADLIKELVLDDSILPVTIGVFGDWGGGKSSIMQMLRDSLIDASSEELKKKNIAVLYFNGWLFEGYDDAKAALLTSILTGLRDSKKLTSKARDAIKSLLRRVDYMRGAKLLLSGAVSAGFAGATGGLSLATLPLIANSALDSVKENAIDAAKESIGEEDQSTKEEVVNDIRSFRDDFQQMLEDSGIGTLVVLIDDLDRCSPERIIENLEAIKLFLNVPNTAFVIGADRRIISQAVAWRYRETNPSTEQTNSAGNERLVEDYLEKLIQVPYRLPKLSPFEVETYLMLLFCKRHLSQEQFSLVHQAAEQLRSTDRYEVFSQGRILDTLKDTGCPDSLVKAMQVGARIAEQVTDVLQGNPRQVKRFLNAFFLRRKLADVAGLEHVQDDVLVKLMLLEYSQPKLFEGLFSQMDGRTGVIEILSSLEPSKYEEDEEPPEVPDLPTEWKPMTNWLSHEPFLTGVDLRDYMWVTRDRLGTTMSSATMVPTVVRNLFRQILSEVGDSDGRRGIKTLTPQELSILVDLLENQAQQKPGEMKAFQGLMHIVDIEGAYSERFIALIERIPKADIAPALAVTLRVSVKKPGHLGNCAKTIIARADGGKSRFERELSKRPK